MTTFALRLLILMADIDASPADKSTCVESVVATRHTLTCDGRRVAAWDKASGNARVYHADGSIVAIDADGTFHYIPRK